MSAPVALFVYNRPTHTSRTVEALLKNALAVESDLFIFSDAARKPNDVAAVCEVREYIKTIGGFKSVNIVERGKNLGLANSIIGGVSRLCEDYGRAIVLEDDLVVAPVFLAYMNKALDKYESEDKVMQVSGYMFPTFNLNGNEDALFLPLTTSWGWGTWQRAWKYFEHDTARLIEQFRNEDMRHIFDLEGTYPYFDTLQAQQRGEMDVWGVRWYASVFLRGGLCLYPSHSLVQNAGMDGSGVHCGASSNFDVDLKRSRLGAFPDCVEECAIAMQQIINFFRSLQEPRLRRVLRRLIDGMVR